MTLPGQKRLSAFLNGPAGAALMLAGLVALAYGLAASRLGWFWDDYPIGWIARTYGADGLARYFSTNRPFWGLLYRVTTPLLGENPLAWQAFALVMRWAAAAAFWAALRAVWPGRNRLALGAAALLAVYPGFSQQYIALVYSHFFIVLTAFFFSIGLHAQALRGARRPALLTAVAWLLASANLLMMEYFFFLELLRLPLVMALLPGDRRGGARWKAALLRVAPFWAVLLGVMVWRTFFFGFHTYQPGLLAALRADPLAGLSGLLAAIAHDVALAGGAAWAAALRLPASGELTAGQGLVYWGTAVAAALLGAAGLLLARPGGAAGERRWAPPVAGLGALLLAGAPFWLTGLPVTLNFPNDRFTLAFMPGACLALAGLLDLAGRRASAATATALAVLLGLSAGLQYRYSIPYLRDWNTQRALFRQMAWRIPALEPGTTLLFDDLPLLHYSDNSLTAPLNRIYAPGNSSQQMAYLLYYPSVRTGGKLVFEPNRPIEENYLAATFSGSTGRMVMLTFHPPECLRVLDPEVEVENWDVPLFMRETLAFNTVAPIRAEGAPDLPLALYGPEPARGWCYYFEQADLARQFGRWEEAAALGDQGFASGDYPNGPLERFPFIEAYAHVGRWDRALELTRETGEISPLYRGLACRLWARIARDLPAGDPPRDAALAQARYVLSCAAP